jgi:hypothetical protein
MFAGQLRRDFCEVQSERPNWPPFIMSSKVNEVNAFVKLGWPDTDAALGGSSPTVREGVGGDKHAPTLLAWLLPPSI